VAVSAARSLAGGFGRKVIRLVLTLFAVSVFTFLLTSLLPGDPAVTILGVNGVTPEALAAVHKDLGLDKPLITRYTTWLGDVLHGDLGTSYSLGRSVGSQITSHLPVTLEIIGLAILIALVVAIPLGVFTAYKASSLADRAISLVKFALLSVPTFVVGIVLILVFAVRLDVLPPSGWVGLSEDPAENLRRALLPALALALPQIAVYTRLLRGDMRSTLDQDFVAFADAKGLSRRRVLLGHALRPSSFSLVTLVGLSVGFLMGGTVVVETMFNVPGVGSLLVNAIYQRDLVMVQGVTLFIAVAFVLVNFVVDLLYSLLDPRIRRRRVAASV
jgi:peptide/nickel transport system permease protein